MSPSFDRVMDENSKVFNGLKVSDPIYEVTELLDHDYEGLERYVKQQEYIYEEVTSTAPSAKQPSATAGDYELTQCPAYGTISSQQTGRA